MDIMNLIKKYPSVERAMNKIRGFSPETYIHSIRVAEITSKIIDRLNAQHGQYCFSEQEKENLIIAAYVHDIGKLSVSRDILSKPGKLTDKEFENIKKHPVAGYIRIKRLNLPKDVDKICSDVAINHHRKIDGFGYPPGIKEPVPYYAQIVQVADVYEALTADRSYREALPHEKAFSMMANGECGTLNETLVSLLKDNCEAIEYEISEERDEINLDTLYTEAYAVIPKRNAANISKIQNQDEIAV